MGKPILSKRLFKNVNMDNIDYESDSLNILERVMYRGDLEDLHEIRRFYGDDRIKKEIVNSKSLGPKEVNFCCSVFKLNRTDFKFCIEGTFRAYPEFKNCPEELQDVYEQWEISQIMS